MTLNVENRPWRKHQMVRISAVLKMWLTLAVLLSFAVWIWHPVSTAQSVKDAHTENVDKELASSMQFEQQADVAVLDIEKFGMRDVDSNVLRAPQDLAVGTDQGEESEPNDTIGTADILTGTEGKIRGNIVGTIDADYFVFTAAAGDRVYAAVMTSITAGSANSILDIRDSSDAILETDLDDGSFASTSSTIAGKLITTPGTYYLRIEDNGISEIRPYDLYFSIKSGSPGAEVEPNDSALTATPIPASGWVSGTRNPASDFDFYSMSLNAGDTVYLGLDVDPERDDTQWNARLGFGLLGTNSNQLLSVDDGSVGSVANPLSETFFFTVQNAGTYFAFVDSATPATASPTFTYNLNVAVIPAGSTAGCTTFTNSTPTAIADLGLTSSTINIPATTGHIRDLDVFINATHPVMQDLDFHLRSPNANDNGFATDIGNNVAGNPNNTMNLWFDDEAAIPPSSSLTATMRHLPELPYRLDWFDGENPTGGWTLDIRDDTAANTGTLNSWSLRICEDAPASGTQPIHNENFEAGDGGYTHSGTADEWERGLPSLAATSFAGDGPGGGPPLASFLNCNSGSNCWKTDLDGTYNVNSSQNLSSPAIAIPAGSQNVELSWAMRYQIENATFDHIWVDVTEVGNPTNTKRVWQWSGPTMTEIAIGNPVVNIGASAGWGIHKADITPFAGRQVNVVFHLDSDTSEHFGGLAVDDVKITRIAPAVPVTVSGRITSPGGRGIAGAYVYLTEGVSVIERRVAVSNSFGYYQFFNVFTQQNVSISASSKRYTCPTNFFFLSGAATSNFACTETP